MAYDEQLADRVREAISSRPDVVEKKMFGGIGFMVQGNLAVGVRSDELLVRLAEEEARKALAEDGVRPFDMGGGRRQPKGWVLVGEERISDDPGLSEWVDAGADYAASLPPK